MRPLLSNYVMFFFSSRRRHTRLQGDWSSDVCSSDLRMRTHGHLHLAQVLHTGKDYVFVDFDGGRTGTLAERRRKGSVLRSEEGRVGEEGRSRGAPDSLKKKKKYNMIGCAFVEVMIQS